MHRFVTEHAVTNGNERLYEQPLTQDDPVKCSSAAGRLNCSCTRASEAAHRARTRRLEHRCASRCVGRRCASSLCAPRTRPDAAASACSSAWEGNAWRSSKRRGPGSSRASPRRARRRDRRGFEGPDATHASRPSSRPTGALALSRSRQRPSCWRWRPTPRASRA